MKHLKLIVLLVLFLMGSPTKLFGQNLGKPNKPNIVLIVSDDQGNADAGYQRTPASVNTPAIDKLAQEGVVFTNGYASAYVCAPTRAGLLTGRYQQRFGFYRAPDSRIGLPLPEITLADVLRAKGYTTGVFGKWHLGLKEAFHPNNRGFDEFYGFLGHGAHDYFDLSLKENPSDFHQAIYKNLNKISDSGYLTDNLAREACDFIKKNADRENPFFLYLPFNAVHTPLQAPQTDIDQFNTGDPKRDILLAMLHRMDIAINNVINTLKERGVYENTIIFFLSDNGGARASRSNNLPLKGAKHSVYEGGLRVPFIMSWPKILAPEICDEPVISIDIMPTICDALRIKLPGEVVYDGKSMLAILGNKKSEALHESLFFDGNDGTWAVRGGDWKLLMSKKNKDLELYNLKDDYQEQKNLVSKFPEKVADLTEKYRIWRSQMGEPMQKNLKKRKK